MTQRPTAKQKLQEDEPVIAGPFSLFDGSFILEFLEPKPSRNASVLLRATYKYDHPLCKKGKAHPQAPPFHLHFQQSESVVVLSGEIGVTAEYSRKDIILNPQNSSAATPHHIAPWQPHQLWPSPAATEDSTILMWAHPNPVKMEDKMDRLFFASILMYVSDVSEGKAKLDLLQVMLIHHFSSTALIMFPTLFFLGPLRWWIPWIFQCLCAYIAMWAGYKPLLRKYMTQDDWEDHEVQERLGMWRRKDL